MICLGFEFFKKYFIKIYYQLMCDKCNEIRMRCFYVYEVMCVEWGISRGDGSNSMLYNNNNDDNRIDNDRIYGSNRIDNDTNNNNRIGNNPITNINNKDTNNNKESNINNDKSDIFVDRVEELVRNKNYLIRIMGCYYCSKMLYLKRGRSIVEVLLRDEVSNVRCECVRVISKGIYSILGDRIVGDTFVRNNIINDNTLVNNKNNIYDNGVKKQGDNMLSMGEELLGWFVGVLSQMSGDKDESVRRIVESVMEELEKLIK
ncbi:hypothetical protein LUQ84_001518 [Hamiltosporidium tvaerminnensis]|nr:hypothetical protein LUQ84_001518 [Hamiltosporidium tvaerminnensis]